jgi:hypothetical protein
MAIATPMKGTKIAVPATSIVKIGDASDVGENGGWVVQIVDTSSLSASIVVKGQCLQVTRENVADQWLAIPYRGLNVNGTVGTGLYVSTALTTNSLIFIPAGGLTVGLDVTFTSGTGVIYVTPVIGSCAL